VSQIPPYDLEWKWGNAFEVSTSAVGGRFMVKGASGDAKGATNDPVAAAAGIGLVLMSTVATHVTVRPYIDMSWQYIVEAAGWMGNAAARGGIDAAAVLDDKFVAGTRRTTEFSASRGSGRHGADGVGVAWVPDIELSFGMAAGRFYIVNFGAWVECENTSGFGAANGMCRMEGLVRFIVVEKTLF